MTIYIVQIILILLIGIILRPNSVKKKKLFLFLSFVILSIVSGFRGYSVGVDTNVYVRWYENISSISIINNRFEPGFTIYMKVLHILDSDAGFLLIVSSAICIGSVICFIYKLSKKPVISVLLYVLLGAYFSQMNTMRQSLALSFTLWRFAVVLDDNMIDRKKAQRTILSLLLIILASSFHSVASITLVPWVLTIRQGYANDISNLSIKSAIFYVFVFSVAIFFGYPYVMRLATRIAPSYATYFHGTWSDSNYNASLLKTLINTVFLIVGTCFFKNKKFTYAQRFALIMLGFSIFFQVLSMRMEIWGRVTSFFSVYIYMLWVPEFLFEIKLRTNLKIIETGIIVFSFIYMVVILIFRPEWTMVVPYVVR